MFDGVPRPVTAVAVIVPAVKLPDASRATIALAVFALVAVVAEFGIFVSEAPDPECAPENVVAVIVPAVKFPDASRATIALAVLAFVAVVAELGMLVRDAPEPENVPAVTVPVTLSDPSVPTLVRDDAVTPDARVVPVRVPAAAVTVMSADPLNATPLMLRAVCNVVAVAAFPVIDESVNATVLRAKLL